MVEQPNSIECRTEHGIFRVDVETGGVTTRSFVRPAVVEVAGVREAIRSDIRELDEALYVHATSHDSESEEYGGAFNKLRSRAIASREANWQARGIWCCDWIVSLRPEDSTAATVSSCFRAFSRPEDALRECEKFSNTRNPALLTSWGSALMDLAEHHPRTSPECMTKLEEAKSRLGKAFAISKSRNHQTEELSMAYRRLRALQEA